MVSSEFQQNELTPILKFCRRLSNILEIDRLYSVFAEVLKEKFSIQRLAIFVYHKTEKKLSLFSSMGLGDINFEIPEADTALWKYILNGEPFDVSDDSGKLLFSKDFKNHNLERLQSQLWVPLGMGDELIGLATIGKRENNLPFDASDRYFLQQLSAHVVVCMNTCHQYEKRRKEKEDLDKTLQNLSLLYSIGKAMNYISDLKNLLQYILSKAIEVTSAEKGSLMLYDMETDQLNIRVLAGMEDSAFQEQVNNNEIACRSFKPGEGIAGRVYMAAKPIVVNNIKEDDIFIDSEKSYVRSIACIPMIVFNDVIGVINVTNNPACTLKCDVDTDIILVGLTVNL